MTKRIFIAALGTETNQFVPFPTGRRAYEEYGVWREKNMAGKTFMGVSRSTFVIGADGNVTSVMHDVKPATHADDVLAALGT